MYLYFLSTMEQSNRTTQHYLYGQDVEHFKELLIG